MTLLLIIVLIVLVAADLNATTKLTKILTPKDNVHLVKLNTIYEHLETKDEIIIDQILKNVNGKIEYFVVKVLIDGDVLIDSVGQTKRVAASQFVSEYRKLEEKPATNP